jgi:methylphosphotriester-DNA--protein-cysteine methyltransferase
LEPYLSEESVPVRKYIGNRETKVYHVNLPLQEQGRKVSEIDVANMVYFDTREEAREAGYKPCGLCVPKSPGYI